MIRQGLQAEGITVSIALCRWFGVPRRSVYYKPVKVPAGRGRSDRDWASPMIRQGLQAEGITVSTKLCRWFGVPRSVYYKPVKSPPKVDPKFVAPIRR